MKTETEMLEIVPFKINGRTAEYFEELREPKKIECGHIDVTKSLKEVGIAETIALMDKECECKNTADGSYILTHKKWTLDELTQGKK